MLAREAGLESGPPVGGQILDIHQVLDLEVGHGKSLCPILVAAAGGRVAPWANERSTHLARSAGPTCTTTDQEAAKAFYSGAVRLGRGQPGRRRGRLLDGQARRQARRGDLAAAGAAARGRRTAGWNTYITVESADAALARAGARRHRPRRRLRRDGRRAGWASSRIRRAPFPGLAAKQHIGAGPRQCARRPVLERARLARHRGRGRFYGELFGWTTEPMEGEMPYLVINTAGATATAGSARRCRGDASVLARVLRHRGPRRHAGQGPEHGGNVLMGTPTSGSPRSRSCRTRRARCSRSTTASSRPERPRGRGRPGTASRAAAPSYSRVRGGASCSDGAFVHRPRRYLALLAGCGRRIGSSGGSTSRRPSRARRRRSSTPCPEPIPRRSSRSRVLPPRSASRPRRASASGRRAARCPSRSPTPRSGSSSRQRPDRHANQATLTPGGLAVAPIDAPPVVQAVIAAGNEIARLPYRFGGGQGRSRTPRMTARVDQLCVRRRAPV